MKEAEVRRKAEEEKNVYSVSVTKHEGKAIFERHRVCEG